MVREEDLKDPIVRHLYSRFDSKDAFKFLAHEEVKTRKSWHPDILFVYSQEDVQVLDNVIEVVEIENKLKSAIRDRKHGLNQLKKYPGHLKYLAIPSTIYRLSPGRIKRKCEERECGLLVVAKSGEVSECIEPMFNENAKSLRAYPVALRRWKKLKQSNDRFRWIRSSRIYYRE